MKKCLQIPPPLKINQTLHPDGSIPTHVRLEQRIVWNLLLILEKAGFEPYSVDDTDAMMRITSKKAAMELLFNLDDAHLFLWHKSKERLSSGHPRLVWVKLVFGNELDVISDYLATNHHGFEDVMEKFNPEEYA